MEKELLLFLNMFNKTKLTLIDTDGMKLVSEHKKLSNIYFLDLHITNLCYL